MKLIWATDIHLDSASNQSRAFFVETINKSQPDAILITGDIATGTTIVDELTWLKNNFKAPCYFVLGNHDYYGSSISSVRKQVSLWLKTNHKAIWLDEAKPIQLSESRFMVGDGGWGDAGNGDFINTPVRLNDHRHIQELTGLTRPVLMEKLQLLGLEAAHRLQIKIEELLNTSNTIDEIVIATHVPPFPESAWYNGFSGAVDWIPDFTCKAIGDLLMTFSKTHSSIQWTVLCGHGHHPGKAIMRNNLTILTGPAEYGTPAIAEVLYFG